MENEVLLKRLIKAWTGCGLGESRSLVNTITKFLDGKISEDYIAKLERLREG